ncbi:TPA: hypothetical protein N3A33_000452 [Salmonella enterica subsp. salamae serovar 28:r:e,n,z15]|nr:hypothetical protein [Salmonella enterica subsp. salamae serovar 28:r:e,n,z15]
MYNKPVIKVLNFNPDEFAAWLLEMAGSAEEFGRNCLMMKREMNSAARSLHYVLECLDKRINFLASGQIVHAEDHANVVQEDLNNMRVIYAAVHDNQKTILALIDQLQKIERPAPAQCCIGHHPEREAPGVTEEIKGQQ